MKQVILIFANVEDIWDFVQEVKPCFLQVRIIDRMVICNCSDEGVQIAVNKYNAVIQD
jgi:hypothetical protein